VHQVAVGPGQHHAGLDRQCRGSASSRHRRGIGAGTRTGRSPADLYASHLTDKILAARPEGERKQVTVLFIDLKDSTELIRGLDPKPRSNSWTPPSSA